MSNRVVRGRADHLELGTWNAICDACGRKFKAHQLRKRWDGFMVCDRDWEPRQPQDFVRARSSPEPAPLPWVRDRPAPDFSVAPVCTPNDTSAIPGIAIPGCVRPGYLNPARTIGL